MRVVLFALAFSIQSVLILGGITEECFEEYEKLPNVTKEPSSSHLASIGWINVNKSLELGCHGALITQNHVLTAASCLFKKFGKPDLVVLGPSSEKVKIEKITIHPDYFNLHFDVALIELEIPKTNRSEFLRPACLWGDDNINELKVSNCKGETNITVADCQLKGDRFCAQTNSRVCQVDNLI